MKKYLNLSLAYAVAAMAGGVFYREFTKLNGFVGVTALGIGKLITSITMTAFYVLLYCVWRSRYAVEGR